MSKGVAVLIFRRIFCGRRVAFGIEIVFRIVQLGIHIRHPDLPFGKASFLQLWASCSVLRLLGRREFLSLLQEKYILGM